VRGHDAWADRLIQNVGRRIAELRRERDWTQAEAAEKLRIEEQSLQRFERGANLTLRTLAKIARVFEVPVQAFFEESQPRPRRAGRPRKKA
jgi:transcriptional regulator with XRE-family HTH domain